MYINLKPSYQNKLIEISLLLDLKIIIKKKIRKKIINTIDYSSFNSLLFILPTKVLGNSSMKYNSMNCTRNHSFGEKKMEGGSSEYIQFFEEKLDLLNDLITAECIHKNSEELTIDEMYDGLLKEFLISEKPDRHIYELISDKLSSYIAEISLYSTEGYGIPLYISEIDQFRYDIYKETYDTLEIFQEKYKDVFIKEHYNFLKYSLTNDFESYGFSVDYNEYLKKGYQRQHEIARITRSSGILKLRASDYKGLSIKGKSFSSDVMRGYKEDFKKKLISEKDAPITRCGYGVGPSIPPLIVADMVELARAEGIKGHPDWDPWAQTFPGKIQGVLTIEDSFISRFKTRMGDPDFGKFNDKIITGRIDITGTNQWSKYRVERYGDTIFILDYKPRYKFNPGGNIASDFLEIYPQLIADGLEYQKHTDLKVLCVPFNDEGADIFDPNRMALEIEAFLFGYVDPHDKQMSKRLSGWMPTREEKGYFMSIIEEVDDDTLRNFILNNIDKYEFEHIVDEYKGSGELEPVRTYYDSYYEGYGFFDKSLNDLDRWRPMEMIVLIELFFDLHFHISPY